MGEGVEEVVEDVVGAGVEVLVGEVVEVEVEVEGVLGNVMLKERL